MKMTMIGLRKIASAAVLSLGLLMGASAPSAAQEISPEHLALARQYVDLTRTSDYYMAEINRVAAATAKLLTQQNPDLTDSINEAINGIYESYKGQEGALYNEIARVYAVEFTQDELQQIIAFYETPVGKRITATRTTVEAGLVASVTVFRRNLGNEFPAKVRAVLREKGYNV